MTTFLTEQSSPRLPAPSEYAKYLERLQAEQAEAHRLARCQSIKEWLLFGALWFVFAATTVIALWLEGVV